MKTASTSLMSKVQSPKSAVCSLQSAVSPKAGFTLIELLVVVSVILLLSGMLFRLGVIISDRSERAKATADLENIKHALNEYYAEYGIYPPVDSTAYEYEDKSKQPPSMQQPGVTDDVGWRYGLVSHLYKRDMANPSEFREQHYNPDTERDIAAKERWAPYLADVTLATGSASNEFGEVVVQAYSNQVSTIRDPWNSEYQYESHPPYQSYRLWSPNLEE